MPYVKPAPQQRNPIYPEPKGSDLQEVLTGEDVPPEYKKLGVTKYRAPGEVDIPPASPVPPTSINEEVDELIKTGRAGVIGRGRNYGVGKPPSELAARRQPMSRPPLSPEMNNWLMSQPIQARRKLWDSYAKGTPETELKKGQGPPPPDNTGELEVYREFQAKWPKLPDNLRKEILTALNTKNPRTGRNYNYYDIAQDEVVRRELDKIK